MVFAPITAFPVIVISFPRVSVAIAMLTHFDSAPSVAAVTVVNHATVHRTKRHNAKE